GFVNTVAGGIGGSATVAGNEDAISCRAHVERSGNRRARGRGVKAVPQLRSADCVVRDGCGFALAIVTNRHSAADPARYVRTLAVSTAANGRRQPGGIKRAAVICAPKLLTRRIKGSGGKDLRRGVAAKIVRSRHASH